MIGEVPPHRAEPSTVGPAASVTVAAAVTDAEIDERLRANELALRHLVAERAELIAEVERRHLWAVEHRSSVGYLRATLNCSSTSARRDLRRSRLLAVHPGLAAAVEGGHIAPEHRSHREFSDAVTRLIAQLDTDGAFDELRESMDGRRATVVESGGELFVSAHGGDALIATQLQAIFEAFTEREHRFDREHGIDRTPAQRRFDTLVAILTSAHAKPSGGSLPSTTVDIVVDARTVHDTPAHAGVILSDRTPLVIDADGRAEAEPSHPAQALLADLIRDPSAFLTRRCQTTAGTPVHPSVLLRSLLTDHVRRVVVDSRSVVTDLGSKSRLFTGHARTAALLLDPTCVFSGCDIPVRWAQVDHNHEHHEGGRTDQRNANVACGHHNRLKHRRRLRTRRDDRGRAYTIRADGTILLPVGERQPDLSGHELDDRARARAAGLVRTRATAGSSPDP